MKIYLLSAFVLVYLLPTDGVLAQQTADKIQLGGLVENR